MTLAFSGATPQGRDFNVNYNYFDIAEGTGYVIYYGARDQNAGLGTETFTTTSREIMSGEPVRVFYANATTSYVSYIDEDYKITFNMPKNIKGNILINVPIGLSAVGAIQYDFHYYAAVSAWKKVGAVETQIGGYETTIITHQTGTNGIASNIKSCGALTGLAEIEAPLTHFKKGEQLMFTISAIVKTTEAANKFVYVMLGADPSNRPWGQLHTPAPEFTAEFANEPVGGGTITYADTRMAFHVPFVLDI